MMAKATMGLNDSGAVVDSAVSGYARSALLQSGALQRKFQHRPTGTAHRETIVALLHEAVEQLRESAPDLAQVRLVQLIHEVDRLLSLLIRDPLQFPESDIDQTILATRKLLASVRRTARALPHCRNAFEILNKAWDRWDRPSFLLEATRVRRAAAFGSTRKMDAESGKYVTFQLGNEELAVPVARVREIMRVQSIMALSQVPRYVKGIITLRSEAIPVVDLRVRFGLREVNYTRRTCIIVASVDSQMAGKRLIGMVVDCVSEAPILEANDIDNIRDGDSCVEPGCLLGMAKINGKVTSLLNVDSLL